MLRYATLLLLVTCLTACGVDDTTDGGPAGADDRTFRWKLATTWPPNLPVFHDNVVRFAADVETMSRGRLQIQVFAGGELIPALEIFDAVKQGSIELGHGSAYYWAGRLPAAQFFSTVPFGMDAQGMYVWLYAGEGLELWREMYAREGLVPFPMGNTGIQMAGWFNKEIASVADLRGLIMRIPGLGGAVMTAAGSNTVLYSGGELYTALERGVIDATEWVGPLHDTRLGLNRVAEYYYYPGWHEPGTALELIVNQAAWEELPPDLQKIIETAATATDLRIYTELEYGNSSELAPLQQSERIKILPLPPEVLANLRTVTQATLDRIAAGNPQFDRIKQSYESFRAEYDAWRAITTDAYRQATD